MAFVTRGDHIKVAVAVDIGGLDGGEAKVVSIGEGAAGQNPAESPVAVVAEDHQRVAAEVRGGSGDDVGQPVIVEIASRQVFQPAKEVTDQVRAPRVVHRIGGIFVPGDPGFSQEGHKNVEVAVAVHIVRTRGARLSDALDDDAPRPAVTPRVAVVLEPDHAIFPLVRNEDVEVAVAVQIGEAHRAGKAEAIARSNRPGLPARSRGRAAGVFIPEDDVVGRFGSRNDDQVVVAVAVHVSGVHIDVMDQRVVDEVFRPGRGSRVRRTFVPDDFTGSLKASDTIKESHGGDIQLPVAVGVQREGEHGDDVAAHLHRLPGAAVTVGVQEEINRVGQAVAGDHVDIPVAVHIFRNSPLAVFKIAGDVMK